MSRNNRQRTTPTFSSAVNPEVISPLVPKYQRILQDDGCSISLIFSPGNYLVKVFGGLYLQEGESKTLPEYLALRKKHKADLSALEQRNLYISRIESRDQLKGVKLPDNQPLDDFIKGLNEEQLRFLKMKERDYRSFLSSRKENE